MKHILNNLSEQEKNDIREQHTGGMKVITENFSKLLNSKLGDSKPFLSEQVAVQPKGGPIQQIQIKIGEFLVNLTNMEKTGQGAKFYGQIRGQKEHQEVLFSCGGSKTAMKTLGSNNTTYQNLSVSPEGLKLLNKTAGCDAYVKNQEPSADNVTLAEQQRPADAIEGGGMGINEVMDLAYRFMNEHCPEGPKDANKYKMCISRLHDLFQMSLRNLSGNVSNSEM